MSNKFSVEYFGDSIGTNDNITRLLTKGQIGMLLTIKDNESLSKCEYIISREEAINLSKQINFLINSSTTKAVKLEVV